MKDVRKVRISPVEETGGIEGSYRRTRPISRDSGRGGEGHTRLSPG